MSGEYIHSTIVAIDDNGVRVATWESHKYKDTPGAPGEECSACYFPLPDEWADFRQDKKHGEMAVFNPWGVSEPMEYDKSFRVQGPEAIYGGNCDSVRTKLFVKRLGEKTWSAWGYNNEGQLIPAKGSTMPEGHVDMKAMVIRAMAKGFKGQLAWSYITYH